MSSADEQRQCLRSQYPVHSFPTLLLEPPSPALLWANPGLSPAQSLSLPRSRLAGHTPQSGVRTKPFLQVNPSSRKFTPLILAGQLWRSDFQHRTQNLWLSSRARRCFELLGRALDPYLEP